jgi:hypothetical protein
LIEYGTFDGVQFSLDDLHYYFLLPTPFLLTALANALEVHLGSGY